jgi:hypothetical protein
LKTTIDELKSLNKTFLTISSQVGRFKTYSLRSNEGSQRIAPAKSKLEAITKFRAIQKASRLLYEALGRACAIHSQHSALLCLAPSCLDPCLNVGIYRIRFTLAIAPFHEAASSGNVDVPNDAIEASSNILEGITTMRISEDPLKSSCSPVSSSASQSSWLEIESLIKDQMVSSQGLILLEQATGALRQAQINQMGANETISRYVRVHEDLCARLHLTISPLDTSSRKAVEVLDATPTSNSDSSSEFYIGTFEDPEICQHHLYCKQGNQSIAADEQYATLAQVISSRLNNRQVGGISQFQRLCIAKHLAVAVLQYHTTPWLSGAWQSSNIVLRNAIPNNDKTVASSLFINARVAKALRTQDPPLSSSSSLHTRDVAPNSVLFALGVMMIEIAYSASFQSLLEPQDYDISPDTRLVNFYAAQRLASNVGVYLGAGFATIIKQCLRCDFGCGEDLNSPGLQEQFYAKVICRLDGLEEGFRKLQSDS